jgi:hypothetical protein
VLNYTTIHSTIGKGFADKFEQPVFAIGTIEFTKREFLEDVGCANFQAAARLQKVLRRLKIITITQLKNLDMPSLYRCKGIGDASIYVAMCILHYYGADVIKWSAGKDKARKTKRKQEV